MASMGKSETKVSELCREFGISRQTLYRHVSVNGEACPDGVRVLSLERRDGVCLGTSENQVCEAGDVSV
jgi:transposase-like protein